MLVKTLCRRLLPQKLVLLEGCRAMCTTGLLRDKLNRNTIDQEDKEELERERELRERFAQKIQKAMPQYAPGGGSCAGTGSCETGARGQPSQFTRLLFFATSIMMLMAIMQMTDSNSPFSIMQNIQLWQLPISSVSYYILMRALLPFREQRRLSEEYENATKQNLSLTLDQFFAQRYPTIFQGNRTDQRELVAAISACLASATDLKFANSISRAAGSARDVRASVDSIMDALRRDYPHVFQSSGVPAPSSMSML